MRPSSPELIFAIAASLEGQLASGVQDKWSASTLRSAVQLLNHLAVRVEAEGRILLEDNRDARTVLEAARVRLEGGPESGELRTGIDEALDGLEPQDLDVAALDARNGAYQAAIEQVLRSAGVRAAGGAGIHASLRAYLKRRLHRERPLYFPVFTGPPF